MFGDFHGGFFVLRLRRSNIGVFDLRGQKMEDGGFFEDRGFFEDGRDSSKMGVFFDVRRFMASWSPGPQPLDETLNPKP